MAATAAADLQQIVGDAVASQRVPGLVAGLLHQGHRAEAAAGHANMSERIEMTPDTLFLLGSITKVWTATALLTLVDEGRVALDDPVQRHLPELRLGDPRAASAITVRMLLDHSSGIDAADHAQDFGANPDSMRLYVDSLQRFGQLYGPGTYFSYCNPGYVIAGRIVEQVTGASYEQAMRDRVFAPLGLTRTVFGAPEAILHRVSVGHFPDGAGGWRGTPAWMLPHCLGPAGATLTTTVRDVLRFAAMHLSGGLAPDASRLLSDQLATAMRVGVVGPPIPVGVTQGLGWSRVELDGTYALRHTGGSMGGLSSLLLLPEESFALSIFANAAGADGVVREVEERVLSASFGEDAARLRPSPERAVAAGVADSELAAYAGVYERCGFRHTVDAHDGTLTMQVDVDATLVPYFGGVGQFRFPLEPLGQGTFAMPGIPGPAVAFIGDDRPEYLYWGLRLARRARGGA